MDIDDIEIRGDSHLRGVSSRRFKNETDELIDIDEAIYDVMRRLEEDDDEKLKAISEHILDETFNDVMITATSSFRAAGTSFQDSFQEFGESEWVINTSKSLYDLKEHLEDSFTVVNDEATAVFFPYQGREDCGVGRINDDGGERMGDDGKDDDTIIDTVGFSVSETDDRTKDADSLVDVLKGETSWTPKLDHDGDRIVMEHLTGAFASFAECFECMTCQDMNCHDVVACGEGLFRNKEVEEDDIIVEKKIEGLKTDAELQALYEAQLHEAQLHEAQHKNQGKCKKQKRWKRLFRRRRRKQKTVS